MEPWLTGSGSPYRFSKIFVPTLPWQSNFETQAAELKGRASVLGTDAVFIGHSQGGLISRRVGQYNASYPSSLVKGVVTIDSPHDGASIAKVLVFSDYEQLIRNLLSRAFVKYCAKTMVACYLDAAAAQAAIADLKASFNPNNSSTIDLKPRSAALNALNSTTENFIRAGIGNNVLGRFKWARLSGDKDHNPEEIWGGRYVQLVTNFFFLSLRSCKKQWWLGSDHTFPCAQVYSTILHLDDAFERFVDPAHKGSDGIVPNPSQLYPNTYSPVSSALNFSIRDGDSHVGALKTVAVREAILRQALPRYGLPLK